MATMTMQQSVKVGSNTIAKSTNATVETQVILDEVVEDSVTDQEHLVAIDVSALKMFAMVASVDMTVDTNDSGTPQETFSLTAGVPVFFKEGDDAIFSGDVTKLFVSNSSGEDGVLSVLAGMDV